MKPVTVRRLGTAAAAVAASLLVDRPGELWQFAPRAERPQHRYRPRPAQRPSGLRQRRPGIRCAIGVHPNTCRYRLARAEEIAGLTLTDPDERLLLWLQLRLGHELGL